MRTVYAYDNNKFFTKTVEQNLDEITKQYPVLINATTIAIPAYDPNLEIPKFVNDAWILEDLKGTGVFYLKTDATEFTEIVKKDANLYTQIEPLKKYDDGTTQAFNDVLQTWEYTFKGADLLEAERVEALSKSKQVKITQLKKDFNASKKITIQNGKILEIAHNTQERKYFLKIIEEVSNLDSIPNTAYEYEQSTDVGGLGFRILPEIATYIFKDLFVAALTNGTKVNARRHNKTVIYNNALEQINNATTQAKLDAVTWTFVNPQGIVIDVNDKAAEMLADSTVSDFAKAAINAAKNHITNEIHLVKTLQELATDS